MEKVSFVLEDYNLQTVHITRDSIWVWAVQPINGFVSRVKISKCCIGRYARSLSNKIIIEDTYNQGKLKSWLAGWIACLTSQWAATLPAVLIVWAFPSLNLWKFIKISQKSSEMDVWNINMIWIIGDLNSELRRLKTSSL